MELKHNTESIYPKLPSAPAEDEGQSYRLQRINEIHKILEGEKEERASLSKKYHRAVKIVDGIDVALIGTTMGTWYRRAWSIIDDSGSTDCYRDGGSSAGHWCIEYRRKIRQ